MEIHRRIGIRSVAMDALLFSCIRAPGDRRACNRQESKASSVNIESQARRSICAASRRLQRSGGACPGCTAYSIRRSWCLCKPSKLPRRDIYGSKQKGQHCGTQPDVWSARRHATWKLACIQATQSKMGMCILSGPEAGPNVFFWGGKESYGGRIYKRWMHVYVYVLLLGCWLLFRMRCL